MWLLWWLRQGAIGPLEATPLRVNVDWLDVGSDTFNLVIRLSNVEQLAFSFHQPFLRCPAAGPLWTSPTSSLRTCSHSEQPETSFLNRSSSFPHSSMAKQATGMSFSCRCGHFGFWWGWTSCASNSLELEMPFMPMWLDLTTVPFGKNARHSRFELGPL